MDSLLLIGAIVLIGVAGNFLFNRTKIPEAVFLIVLGLLIGPLLQIINPEPFIEVAPFFAKLALIIILLDSGLALNIFTLVKNFSKTLLFGLLVLILSITGTTMFLNLVLHWNFLNSLFIAIITAGTTSITVSYLVSRLSVDNKFKDLLMLESVISDVLLITAAIIVMEVIVSQTITFKSAAGSIASSFAIALMIGVALAIFWIYMLGKLKSKLGYVATLGVLFILYAIVEYLKGSGAIAVLVFCLLLGNSSKIINRFNLKTHTIKALSGKTMSSIHTVQSAISFFTKTFFFVLLGIIFSVKSLSSNLVLIAVGLLIIAMFARYLSSKVLVKMDRKFKDKVFLLTTILPRGFVSAVLAFMPANFGVNIPYITEIALLIIFLTTFVAIASVALYEKGYLRPQPLKNAKNENQNT
ncbi:MAG: cation:proton antiporter [Nanoarchaeota archaeon]|nr:cation:proton antiporter [Nanoarchaeota archaeon]MBU4241781.1 cation:proton antiporter [Nanoarchaeota archaeon]MBU4352314.1 cation:proton antiporter [Nanoarchaeota archaeon]MBU4456050.1 cation:proton antiporter [Nanoarchaeota archaeon]MCG2719857.1 cation:proton antiporter [Nanoarchaeota archaeon]